MAKIWTVTLAPQDGDGMTMSVTVTKEDLTELALVTAMRELVESELDEDARKALPSIGKEQLTILVRALFNDEYYAHVTPSYAFESEAELLSPFPYPYEAPVVLFQPETWPRYNPPVSQGEGNDGQVAAHAF